MQKHSVHRMLAIVGVLLFQASARAGSALSSLQECMASYESVRSELAKEMDELKNPTMEAYQSERVQARNEKTTNINALFIKGGELLAGFWTETLDSGADFAQVRDAAPEFISWSEYPENPLFAGEWCRWCGPKKDSPERRCPDTPIHVCYRRFATSGAEVVFCSPTFRSTFEEAHTQVGLYIMTFPLSKEKPRLQEIPTDLSKRASGADHWVCAGFLETDADVELVLARGPYAGWEVVDVDIWRLERGQNCAVTHGGSIYVDHVCRYSLDSKKRTLQFERCYTDERASADIAVVRSIQSYYLRPGTVPEIAEPERIVSRSAEF